jgi:hypothetical protein
VHCSAGTNCFEWIKVLSPTVVAFIFGVIAARLTWNQYQVAQAKLKLDLFERRYAIFQKVWQICSLTFHHGTRQPTFKGVGFGTPFNNFRPEAAFLFGKGIQAYIDELAEKWGQYHGHEGMRDDDARKSVDLGVTLQDYFFAQADHGVKDQFSPFLNFDKWK